MSKEVIDEKDGITIIEINKPTKEDAKKKVGELSKFLSNYYSIKCGKSEIEKPKTKKYIKQDR